MRWLVLVLWAGSAEAHVGANMAGLDVLPPPTPADQIPVDASFALLVDASFGLLWDEGDAGYTWVCHETIVAEGAALVPRFARSSAGVLLGTLGTLEQARDPGESVYRSDDGCEWAPPTGLTGRVVSDVAFDPDAPDRAIAGTADLAAGAQNSLHYSVDAGRGWIESDWSSVERSVTAVVVPGGDGASWATAITPGGGDATILRSLDAGETWATHTLDPLDWATAADRSVRVVAASRVDPDTAWVVVAEPGAEVLLRTTNAGASFEQVLVADGRIADAGIDAAGVLWVLEEVRRVLRSHDGVTFEEVPGSPPSVGLGVGDDEVWVTSFADFTGVLMSRLTESDDFETALLPANIVGVRSCPAESDVAVVCGPLWATLAERIALFGGGGGGTDTADEPDTDTDTDTPEEPRPRAPEEASCGCAVGSTPTGALLPLLLLALARRRRAVQN